MTATATALLVFAAWSILLVAGIALCRTWVSMTAGKALNSFSPAGTDLPAFGTRLTRAHANTYEFLPVAGAVMLYAIATDQTTITDNLANVFIGARLAQSIAHIASTSMIAVLVRFAFFFVQVAVVAYWILCFLFPATLA
jgi:uncharacterized MAPEG superfamily protein